MTSILCFDAETYYEERSTTEGEPPYSLTNYSTAEYILHPKFKLLGFGLATDKGSTYIHGDTLLRTPAFRKRLEESIVVCHHAHFDVAILTWIYGIKPKGIICTLSMARALGLRNNVGGSLKALCKKFNLGDKPDLRPDSSPEEVELRGWWDADATLKLFKILAVGFPKEEYGHIDMTARQFTESVVEADVPKLQEVVQTAKEKREAALASLGVTAKDVGSNLKLIALLENLGVEVPYKTSPTHPDQYIPAFAKTDDGMQELLNHDDPTVKALAETRVMIRGSTDETRAATYVRLAQAHGKLPIYYNYWATHPGRWGGSDGTNFANLKRGGVLRDCLLPPPGHLFVEADMKQIQARLAAWLAGQDDLLQAFAQGRDVYCEFGGDLFGRAVTKADKFERFCAKFWVLGGWFGMGGEAGAKQLKARINAEKHPFTPPTVEEANAQVWTLRNRYDKMMPLWDEFERFLARPGSTLGPLVMEPDAVLLPNGTRIYYPQLRQEHYKDFRGKQQFGWRYTGREGRTALWGGKQTQNCIGEGTEVLTDRGWLPIEQITLAHRIWDGLEWVNHSGVICSGPQMTIEVAGIRMTPEHQILTTKGWIDGQAAHGLNRATVRHPHGVETSSNADCGWAQSMACALRLRYRAIRTYFRRQDDASLSQLLHDVWANDPRDVEASSSPRLGLNDPAMQKSYVACLAQLRRSWDKGLQTLGEIRKFLDRHGADLSTGYGPGSPRQQPWIFAGQLSLGVAQSQLAQQAQHAIHRYALGAYHDTGSGRTFRRTRGMYTSACRKRNTSAILVRSVRYTQQVYDIANCGPRNRFVVRGGDGPPLIVHNCCLALERVLLARAMTMLRPYWNIVMHTYDSLTLCVKENQVDSAKSALTYALTHGPEWAKGLPLGVDIGVGKNYGECGDK